MDILKRSLAPITEGAWQEIDDAAREMLQSHLSARRFVDVSGPNGWDFAAVPLGRLDLPKNQPRKDVQYGVHAVQPLVESRITFDLQIRELDNVARGSKDPDLEPLEEAARKIALFEETAIYQGFKPGRIPGLLNSGENDAVNLAASKPGAFLDALNQAMDRLREAGIEGPYTLVIQPGLWRTLNAESQGYPFRRHLEALITGEPTLTPSIEGALLVSARGGDLELTLGQDLSLGYQSQTADTVTLFLTESFTFRIVEPRSFVRIAARKK